MFFVGDVQIERMDVANPSGMDTVEIASWWAMFQDSMIVRNSRKMPQISCNLHCQLHSNRNIPEAKVRRVLLKFGFWWEKKNKIHGIIYFTSIDSFAFCWKSAGRTFCQVAGYVLIVTVSYPFVE